MEYNKDVHDIRFQITSELEIFIHGNSKMAFKASGTGMLCHYLRLTVILGLLDFIDSHPVLYCAHIRERWHSEFTTQHIFHMCSVTRVKVWISPHESAAHDIIILVRPLLTGPDIPLMNISDCGITSIPTFPSIWRPSVVWNLWKGILSDKVWQNMLINLFRRKVK